MKLFIIFSNQSSLIVRSYKIFVIRILFDRVLLVCLKVPENNISIQINFDRDREYFQNIVRLYSSILYHPFEI